MSRTLTNFMQDTHSYSNILTWHLLATKSSGGQGFKLIYFLILACLILFQIWIMAEDFDVEEMLEAAYKKEVGFSN